MTDHVWDGAVKAGGMFICARCGSVAEQNDTYDGWVFTRHCTDAPNVIGMTLRRAQQIRDASAKRASKMQWSPEGA
jgi:hypothetical protein